MFRTLAELLEAIRRGDAGFDIGNAWNQMSQSLIGGPSARTPVAFQEQIPLPPPPCSCRV